MRGWAAAYGLPFHVREWRVRGAAPGRGHRDAGEGAARGAGGSAARSCRSVPRGGRWEGGGGGRASLFRRAHVMRHGIGPHADLGRRWVCVCAAASEFRNCPPLEGGWDAVVWPLRRVVCEATPTCTCGPRWSSGRITGVSPDPS